MEKLDKIYILKTFDFLTNEISTKVTRNYKEAQELFKKESKSASKLKALIKETGLVNEKAQTKTIVYKEIIRRG